MRILNRPMFRYGGPIKEGVMHGMRDGGRTIAGGHQIGTPMGNRTGFADPSSPGFWARFAANYAPKNLTPKKLLSRILPWKRAQAVKYVKPAVTNIMARTGLGGARKGITGTGAGSTFMQNLRSFSFPGSAKALGWAKKAKDVALKYPKSTAVGSVYAGKPLYDLATGPGKKLVETVADVAVPDWLYNWETGRWFNPDDTDLKPSDKKILKEKTGIGAGAQFQDTAPELTASQRDKLAKDQQNARLKNYLDMMGYDSSKRRALDDALIDASALTQDATTEAGSLKHADWGKLINKMIQTTSKRLDKPEQIREAVGLMMTKGEIEKDIAAGKGGALKQNARDLVSAGVYKTEREALEHLSKKAGFEEVVGALSAKKDVTGKVLADAWRISGEGIPTESFKGSDDVYKSFKEKMEDAGKGTNIELEFVDKMIDDKKPGDVFIVDDRMVIVNADGTIKYRW